MGEAERKLEVFILNYLPSWLWVSCGERYWEVVEAFIKCSSGPGEALVNVPIISGVGQRLALCPNDSCLMHLCSPCHLTSPLEVAGWGGLTKSSHKAHKGQGRPCSYSSSALRLLNMGGELLHVSPVDAQSPHSKPFASRRVNLNSGVVRGCICGSFWSTLLLCSLCTMLECLSREPLMRCRET